MKRSVLGQISLYCFLVFLVIVPSLRAAPVVLFDQYHGQRFLPKSNRPLDLSGFAGLFTEEGALVRTSTTMLTAALLKDVQVLVISGPFVPISPQEVAVIMAFLGRGGKLALMLHIGQPFYHLLPKLSIAVSKAVVRDQTNAIGVKGSDFRVKNLTPHPLTRGVTSFNIYGGWALLDVKKDGQIIAQTSPQAWLDLNRDGAVNNKEPVQSFTMVLTGQVGEGTFVVFGDDAIFQNRFLSEGNLHLARNLVRWFAQ